MERVKKTIQHTDNIDMAEAAAIGAGKEVGNVEEVDRPEREREREENMQIKYCKRMKI